MITNYGTHTVKFQRIKQPDRVIDGKSFWRALSEAEQRAIAGSGTQAAKALLWELAICGNLSQAEALAALNRMEAATLITAERKAEIINALR